MGYSAGVIVYDITDGQLLDVRSEGARVLIVFAGNKTDLEGMRVASREKARIRHLEVSANEETNIEQLLSVLIQ